MQRTTFPGTLDSLEGIRDVARDEAQRAGLSKKATYKLMLALDEIATNIILYGYEKPGLTGTIDVLTEHADGQLNITLEDDAAPFDPLQRELPDAEDFAQPLEDRPIGGLGIYLTLDGVDEFRYELADQRNRNIFIMKTDAASAVGAAGPPGQG